MQPPSKEFSVSSANRSEGKEWVIRVPVLLLILLPWPMIFLWQYAPASPLIPLVFLGLGAVWGVLFMHTLVEYVVSGFGQWASSTGRELGRVYAIIKRGR